ncbi:MAG TPA: TAXI family TRAP transporter solute-binding subunit [Polyangiaceae bacterium]
MPPNLERPLGNRSTPPHPLRGLLVKVGAFTAGALLLAVLVSRVDLTHDLSRLHVAVLSGDPQGHYHAIVTRTAELARERRGTVTEVASAGSVENVQRLRAAAAKSCEVQFALVQDGTDLGDAHDAGTARGTLGPLAVYGRFARREAVLFLGKDADRLHAFADLQGMRIGVGPAGSGTEHIARQIFTLPDFAGLGVSLTTHPLDEQVAMLAAGSLDLGVFVMQDDAPLVVDAIVVRGLQIASFAHTAGIAKRLPHLQAGHVYAGIYDAVRGIPSIDKDVLRVETLLLGNGCAGRTQTVDLLGVLAQQFPDFVRHNKDTENTTPLPTAPVAKEFFDSGGPQLADEYVPWLVDVMPPANWAYVVMGVSLLFNAMGAGHRFRLWRIDASRVHLEERLVALFGAGVTLGDIQAMGSTADAKSGDGAVREGVRALVVDFEELAARSRRQSLSMLVPMGQEMAYRYQEGVIYESLTVLRGFLRNGAGA